MSIIFDIGSRISKVGYAGQPLPLLIFPTVISSHSSIEYVGEEAVQKKELFPLVYPVQAGVVLHFDDLERIWHHTFYTKLEVYPEEHFILLMEAVFASKASRERMTKIMMETFNVKGLYISYPAALSLVATGRRTGVVLECGADLIYSVPIYEGYFLPMSMQRLGFGGQKLTNYLSTLLLCNTPLKEDEVEKIKEHCCYVALDYDLELLSFSETPFEFQHTFISPNGPVKLGKERFICPEALFKPSLLGESIFGVHQMIFQSIRLCDIDIRDEMYKNIVLSGGSSLFEGLADRIYKELSNLAPLSYSVHIVVHENRKYLSWIGGSIVASEPNFNEKYITKEDYEEFGPGIVHRKCFL